MLRNSSQGREQFRSFSPGLKYQWCVSLFRYACQLRHGTSSELALNLRCFPISPSVLVLGLTHSTQHPHHILAVVIPIPLSHDSSHRSHEDCAPASPTLHTRQSTTSHMSLYVISKLALPLKLSPLVHLAPNGRSAETIATPIIPLPKEIIVTFPPVRQFPRNVEVPCLPHHSPHPPHVRRTPTRTMLHP